MSSENYVARIRESRKRPSVIKTKVFTIRSGYPDDPIYIFEGKSDVGPYETWINRIDDTCVYKGLPGEGKAQVLEFREFIRNSSNQSFHSIYFFVDHDFDGLRGFHGSDNIFCLNTYSFENYLVTPTVLDSILNDELECTAELKCKANTHTLYRKVFDEFSEAMRDANFRLFLAVRHRLNRGRIENKLTRFVEVDLSWVLKKYDSEEIKLLIPLDEEASETQVSDALSEFEKIHSPMESYRGKYILSFFWTWLDQLAKARKAGTFPFDSPAPIKYTRVSLSERSLASRSEVPSGLKDFILSIR